MTLFFVKVFVDPSQKSKLFKCNFDHCPALEQYLHIVGAQIFIDWPKGKKKKKDPKTEIYFNTFILKKKNHKIQV